MNPRLRNGMLFAFAAHFMWGVFPIFWRQVDKVPALELVWHRILWALVVIALVVGIRFFTWDTAKRNEFKRLILSPKNWGIHMLSGWLITINWLAFLWAVNSENVLHASLGYYINPLVNVFLGVVFLSERLSSSQWTAIAIAAVGVTVMTIAAGALPYTSLAMATSFGLYGLAKNKITVDPLTGMFFEMATLAIPTAVMLAWFHHQGGTAFDMSWQINGLLMIGGVITVIPLALFAAGAQRAPLALIGILQYVGPTLQFLVGVVWFGESFDRYRMIGFGFVWIGSFIFLASAIAKARKNLRERNDAEEVLSREAQ